VGLTRAGNSLWPTQVPDPRPGLAANLDDGIARPLEGGFERQRAFASVIARYDWNGHEISYSFGKFRSIVWSINNFFNRANRPGQDPNFGALIGVPGGVTVNPLTTTRTSSNPVKTVFENDSHQILVLSPGDERLRWRAGLYYFQEDNVGSFPFLFGTPANPSGQSAGPQTFDNRAAFGGVDFDVTERLTVSAEARYQVEKNIWQACDFCGTRTVRDEEREEKDFLPRATLDFKLSANHLLYALYSRGVKSGRLSNLAIAVNGQPDFVYATPEQLDNYEIGSKNTFWDGRAVVNLAFYRANVTDQQIVSTQDVLTSAGARLITAAFNVGESRVNGAEIEATVKPFAAWTFGLGIGYADQEFTNGNPVLLQASTAAIFPGAPGSPVIIEGKTQANVPAWNGSVTAAYKSTLGGSGLDLDVRLDGLYRGSFYADLANIAQIPDSWKANLRVGIGRRDNWQASLYARNLLNDGTATVTGLAGGAATCTFIETNVAQFGASQQCLYAFMPRPREVGVEFTYRF
jgi:iron complex outermembrane recepter protein